MTGAAHEGRHGEHIAKHLQAAARGFGGATPAATVPATQDAGEAGDEHDEAELEEADE